MQAIYGRGYCFLGWGVVEFVGVRWWAHSVLGVRGMTQDSVDEVLFAAANLYGSWRYVAEELAKWIVERGLSDEVLGELELRRLEDEAAK